MELQNKAHKIVYEQVRNWLTALLGDQLETSAEGPVFGVRNASAFVQIAVAPLSEQETAVRVYAVVVHGVEVEQQLLAWLLAQNAQVPLGAFALDAEGDVLFLHTMIGSLCTKELLSAVLQVVATVAEQAGTAIVARWGGERAFEDDATTAHEEDEDEGDDEEAEQAEDEEASPAPADAAAQTGAPDGSTRKAS